MDKDSQEGGPMLILIPDQQNVLDASQQLARRSLTERGRNPRPEEIDPLFKAVWRRGASGPHHEAAPTGVLSRPERLCSDVHRPAAVPAWTPARAEAHLIIVLSRFSDSMVRIECTEN